MNFRFNIFFFLCLPFSQNLYADTHLWEKFYGGTEVTYASKIRKMPDGSFIIVGGSSPSLPEGEGVWILKINTMEDTIWTKFPFQIQKKTVWAKNVGFTQIGGIIVVGQTSADPALDSMNVFLLKMDFIYYHTLMN